MNTDTSDGSAAAAIAEQILAQIVAAKGGAERPGQTLMAKTIAQSMTTKTPLLIEGGTGIGKALDVETLIPTPGGFRRLKALRKGDLVFDESGRPVKVTHAFAVRRGRPCYLVQFDDGSTIVADGEHLWDTIQTKARRSGEGSSDPWEGAATVTTEDIAETINRGGAFNHHIPVAGPLQLPDPERDYPVDPYTLGVWLFGPRAHSGDAPDKVRIRKMAGETIPGFTEDPGRPGSYHPDATTVSGLRSLGLLEVRDAIPERYIFAPSPVRAAVLAAAADVAGVVNRPPRSRGQVVISHANSTLMDSLRVLTSAEGIKTTRRDGQTDGMPIRPPSLAFSPARSPFRLATPKKAKLGLNEPIALKPTARRRAIVSVTPIESRPVRCITVDSPTHRYLAGEALIPTHNSIGYLAGAIASGKQTVVAPHTKALQDQLVSDLDLISSAYDSTAESSPLRHAPTYSVIKGRASYACLRKTKGSVDDPTSSQGELFDPVTGESVDGGTSSSNGANSELGQEVKAIHEWLEETETGDRADLPFAVSNRAWKTVSTTADDCIGSRCPFAEECFSERVRAEAKDSDVIVVNQAYLATAMKMEEAPLLPEDVGGIVVDEAHEFASVCADVFGAKVSKRRVENVLKACAQIAEHSNKGEEALSDTEQTCERFDALALPNPEGCDRVFPESAAVHDLFVKLKDQVMLIGGYAQYLPQGSESEKGARDTVVRMLDNLCSDLALILDGNTDEQVVWAEEAPTGGVEFHAAQFDPADVIFERLLKRYKSVVFTSATLSIGGSFDLTAQRHGFGLKGTPWRWQRVQSPFDYPAQGRIFYPPNMPSPTDRSVEGRAAYFEACGEVSARVAKAAGGRTMVLCTSWAAVKAIGEHLMMHLNQAETPVLMQEQGVSAKHVAKEFAEHPNTVLVGTRTFWTGVSVEGDTCAAVVLAQMPFPSPADPIIAARTEKADRVRKWEGFRTVMLAEAILTSVQGSGRLIRTVSDRGVVVSCDPRIARAGQFRKSYARDVAQSLPPFGIAADWAETEAYLGDIARKARPTETASVVIDDGEEVAV